MTPAHGPQWVIVVGHAGMVATEGGELGVRFFPNATFLTETPNYREGQYVSLIDGLPLGRDEALGQPGTRGYAFTRESDALVDLDVSFIAKPDGGHTLSQIQLNGMSLLHQPGYEKVLAALRQICEEPRRA